MDDRYLTSTELEQRLRKQDDARAAREARKCGTDSPHEPTDDFVAQAFAEGARSLWPDSRDPGWLVTFQRWLAKHDAAVAADPANTGR